MSSSESDDDSFIPVCDRIKRPRFNDSELIGDVEYRIYGDEALEETKKMAEEEYDKLSNGSLTKGLDGARTKDDIVDQRRSPRVKGKCNATYASLDSDGSNNTEDVQVICSPLKEPTPPASPSPARVRTTRATRRRGSGRGTARGRSRRKVHSSVRGKRTSETTGSAVHVISDEEDYNAVMIVPQRDNSVYREHLVKVKYSNSKIQRYPIAQHDSFDSIIAEIARDSNVDRRQVELYLGERHIHDYDTVESVGVSVTDILDVLIVRDPRLLSTEEDATVGSDAIELFVQSNLGKKRMSFFINQTDTLDRVLRLYCAKHSLNHQSAELYFDGELLQRWQTPDSLDLEDEDCIDIKFPPTHK